MFSLGIEMRKEHLGEKIADFSIGNPHLSPPKEFIEALRAHAGDKDIHRYMPNAGFTDVRERIAGWLEKKFGIPFRTEHVVMTVGAAGGMNAALKTVLNAGEEVLLLEPWFCEYKFYAENHGGRTTVARTRENFDLDFKELGKKITEKTRAIIFNSPNNPTGKVYSEKELQEFAELLRGKQEEFNSQIYVLSDEPYREIVFEGKKIAPSICSYYENSFMIYSWSKSLNLPGERIGYIAAHPELDDKRIYGKLAFTNRILGYVNAPALMQKAVADVLDLTVDISPYRGGRRIISPALRKAGYEFTEPEGTFYFFPKSPLENELEFVEKAAEKLVLVTPGRGFGRKGYFRISYATDRESIELGAERLAELAGEIK